MPEPNKFEFSRSRGVIWVCDIVGSSKYLNDDKSVDLLEEFIQRLYWTSIIAVEAAGGQFIKWTGDGFLAWFETPLYRELGKKCSSVFLAAWHLTFLVNVTQLGLSPERKFNIRHGITYEQDALITTITHPNGHKSLDITGRAVVLAFRFSGVKSQFPSMVTQRELVEATRREGAFLITFKKWNLTSEDRLRYFKGENWGTNTVFICGDRKKRSANLVAVIRKSKRAIAVAEGQRDSSSKNIDFIVPFLENMCAGPDWGKAAVAELTRFTREEMLGSLKGIVSVLEGFKIPEVENQM